MRTIRAVDLRYGSVCSGIEAASVAWSHLGWTPAFFAEIEPFPSAVLAHRFPEVCNLGDFTKIGADAGPIDILVGGTPCQSFSVAGLRGGMADERGNLAIEYLRLADRLRPRWLVWENVPGVLSSGRGGDFGAFIGGLAQLGYGWAYRVLDAQYFGVPQRRRRVFVVGHLGSWQRAAAVLFERQSLSRHPPPEREAREEVAGCLGGGAGERGWAPDTDRMTFIPQTAGCLQERDSKGADSDTKPGDSGADAGETAPSLRAMGHDRSRPNGGGQVSVAFNLRGRDGGAMPECADVASLRAASGGSSRSYVASSLGQRMRGQDDACADNLQVVSHTGVRRLMPVECERLQGFPDCWTDVPYRGKPAADGPRYKAIGNSMAVPVMRWIGERIAAVDQIGNAVSVRTAKALCREVLR